MEDMLSRLTEQVAPLVPGRGLEAVNERLIVRMGNLAKTRMSTRARIWRDGVE
jgi:hypothetical protein